MSDVPAGHLRYREIDIPARFIRQAIEHVGHTQARYVTFIFTGEMTEDAICVGVTTRLMITGPRATRPVPVMTVETLSEAAVLEIVRTRGPISTQQISDALGIARSDEGTRAKVRRFLAILTASHAVQPTGPERYPNFVVADGMTMPVRKSRTRRITRKHITDDSVIEQLRAGHVTSRAIGDTLGIPRSDNLVRSKITEIIGKLLGTGRVRATLLKNPGGRVYELRDEAAMETEQ